MNFTSVVEDMREIARCSQILFFFHVNAYGCSEILWYSKKCESAHVRTYKLTAN